MENIQRNQIGRDLKNNYGEKQYFYKILVTGDFVGRIYLCDVQPAVIEKRLGSLLGYDF